MWQHITKALLSLFLLCGSIFSLKLLGSKLTFPICVKAGYKGWERVVKAGNKTTNISKWPHPAMKYMGKCRLRFQFPASTIILKV